MNVLGLSCFYHDAAAALLRDGVVVAACQEERLSRKKHDPDFPARAVKYVLREAGLRPEDLDAVGFYDKPLLKFERILASHVSTFPRSFGAFRRSMPVWLKEKLWTPALIRRELAPYAGPILFAEHHVSHAASAFLVSPFEEAAVLTIDGVGEWATASYGVGRGNDITLLGELRFPHSLGLLYSAFTTYLGFKVNSAEYKVMGLAPYGRPVHYDRILREMVHLRDDGSFTMAMEYFAYAYGLTMTTRRFHDFFGGPPRAPESRLTAREFDIAASVQKVCEEVVLRMARHALRVTGLRDLCMAGGVALNCVANGRVVRETDVRGLFVQPAAGDAGGAVGVAHYIYNTLEGRPRVAPWEHAFLGPAYDDGEVRACLAAHGARWRALDDGEVPGEAARLLAEGKVVGWFQGRMEFGPRALGARSILADPRDPAMRDALNRKIKFREGFRPFAPAVRDDRAADWFELDRPSPYMLLVAKARAGREPLPAVTHVDGSARVQTVDRETNPRFFALLEAFERLTGVPVVVNTSFNVRGEPVVCSPDDAYRCFMRTDMDALVIGRSLLLKSDQPPLREATDWRDRFELD